MTVYKLKSWFVASIGNITTCATDRKAAMDMAVKAHLEMNKDLYDLHHKAI